MEPVLSKRQNFRLWQSGAFGNKLRAWRTVEDLRASGFDGLVALRVLSPGGNGPCQYNVPNAKVESEVCSWLHTVPRDAIMLNEMAPDDVLVLQGEYLNDIYVDQNGDVCWGYFRYSRLRLPMRLAFRHECALYTRQTIRADLMIREAMTPSSYEDWQVLLDQYPGHVLEVSIYSRCLGDVPGRNALVWEVRRY